LLINFTDEAAVNLNFSVLIAIQRTFSEKKDFGALSR